MHNFSNKVIWVTGAGSGIGLAICRSFALESATVILNDVDAVLAETAVATLNAELGTTRVFAFAGSVADIDTMRQHAHEIETRFKRLDVFVANAGITDMGPFLDYSVEAFDRVTAVNLRGTYFSAQAAAQIMVKHNIPGRIILTSSNIGEQAMANLSAYSMTKAAIRMLARSLALELGPHGLTVNSISPGPTITARTLQELPDYGPSWSQFIPTGKAISPEDVAAAALFLASPEARQINGNNINIDGGWTAYSPAPRT